MQTVAGSRQLLQQQTQQVLRSSSSSGRTVQRRMLRCRASKTTSGRATTSSKSRAGTTSSKPPAPAPLPAAKQQDRVSGLRERVAGALDHLTPKQEGDIGDVLMMSLSMAVLIYFSMQLYRLYAWSVFSAGMFS